MTTTEGHGRPGADEIRRGLARIERDADFARLIAGRRVAVVGPAETLVGAGRGPEIDASDVVVRFNTAVEYIPFPAGLARDVGARTDVLYCNNEVLVDRIVRQQGLTHARFVAACEWAGVKYVVGVNNDFTFGGERSPQARDSAADAAEFESFLGARGVAAKFRMLHTAPAVLRGWLGGYIGRTGFIGIVDLLRHEPGRLRLTGMSFYHRGGHLFLADSIRELHPMGNQRGEVPRGVLGHNSYLELEILKTLARCYGPTLELDEHLRRLSEAGDAGQLGEV